MAAVFSAIGFWICFSQIELLEAGCPAKKERYFCCSSASLRDGVRGHPECVLRGMDWTACCGGYRAEEALLEWPNNYSGANALPSLDFNVFELPVGDENDYGRMWVLWALIRETLPEGLNATVLRNTFNEVFGVSYEHPAWSYPQSNKRNQQKVLESCDHFPSGSGALTHLQLAKFRMMRPIAMSLWATKEIALSVFLNTSIGRYLSVLQSAQMQARRVLFGSVKQKDYWKYGMSPYGMPLSYEKALHQLLEHVPQVRAIALKGDYLRVAQKNQLFATFLHHVEHLLQTATALPLRNGSQQIPNPVTLNDTACCHRSTVLKMLIAQLRKERPRETLQVAEVGVAWGITSFYTMTADPKMQYLGADVYLPDADAKVAGSWNFVEHAQRSAELIFHRFGGKLMKNFSNEVAETVANQSLDLIFVDGDHTFRGVLRDVRSWLPKVKPGGFFVGHDMNADWPGVARAICRTRQSRPISFGADFTYWWRV